MNPPAAAVNTERSNLPRITGRQTLLFDADDTLWENNIYFDRAIEGFLDLMTHPSLSSLSSLSRHELRCRFNALEHERVKLHGYGTNSFQLSMLAAFEAFLGRACDTGSQECIAALANTIRRSEIELLAGVAETLGALSERHTLVLMTKGDHAEQTEKLARSGLQPLFSRVEVVREKHREAYLDLHQRHACELQSTWMIGNSPKSDINPALAAGMHAVFVPHANTWVLEHEEVAPVPHGQHLLKLNSLSELLHFL